MAEIDYKKKYEEALARAEEMHANCKGMSTKKESLEILFPELKERYDKLMRKLIIEGFECFSRHTKDFNGIPCEEVISWLEKQGEKSSNKLQVSDELYEYIRNTCACIDDALTIEALGDRSDYLSMAKHSAQSAFDMIEKQCGQKSKDRYTFNAIPRLLEMIKPTDRAKAYCQKLIDSLQQEGYVTDAKIISNCLKLMNGEEVSMAVMDETQGKAEEHACDICAKEHPGHSCADITELCGCRLEHEQETVEVGEKDEKIRKALIENFKFFCGDFPETTKWGKDDDLLVTDIISWLEKQVDKDKPCGASSKDVQWTINDARDDAWVCILREYKNQKDITSKDE